MAGIGRRRVPVQLTHREAVAVGGQQGHGVALDLDPHPGEDRQGVATVGGHRHLGHGLGEQVPVDGPARLGRRRQRRVVVGRHHQQAEPRRAARDLHLRALGDDVDRPVRQVARDVGEQPPEHQDRARLGDLGRDGDAGRDLVVERGEGQRAVVLGVQQDAGQHRHRGTCGKTAGHPGDRFGQDVTLDAKLHGIPPRPARRARPCSCTDVTRPGERSRGARGADPDGETETRPPTAPAPLRTPEIPAVRAPDDGCGLSFGCRVGCRSGRCRGRDEFQMSHRCHRSCGSCGRPPITAGHLGDPGCGPVVDEEWTTVGGPVDTHGSFTGRPRRRRASSTSRGWLVHRHPRFSTGVVDNPACERTN